MPVIFIMSAIVSRHCALHAHIYRNNGDKEIPHPAGRPSPFYQSKEEIKSVEINVIKMTAKYLLLFMIFAISLELLDLIFRATQQ